MGRESLKTAVLLTTFVVCVALTVDVGHPTRSIQRTAGQQRFPNPWWRGIERSPRVSIRPRSSNGIVQLGQDDTQRPISSNLNSALYTVGGHGVVNVMRLYMSNDINAPDPPPHGQVAKMARYIVSQSLWTSLSTISSRDPTTGSPFASVVSVSDGTLEKSTGVPYFYLTPIDHSVVDLQSNPNASLVMTLAQGNYCNSHHYDPEDPRCAITTLNGQIVKIPTGSEEEKLAKLAMFTKHPVMQSWPDSHHWFFAKLDVKNILVRDYFGGTHDVDVKEYFATNP